MTFQFLNHCKNGLAQVVKGWAGLWEVLDSSPNRDKKEKLPIKNAIDKRSLSNFICMTF